MALKGHQDLEFLHLHIINLRRYLETELRVILPTLHNLQTPSKRKHVHRGSDSDDEDTATLSSRFPKLKSDIHAPTVPETGYDIGQGASRKRRRLVKARQVLKEAITEYFS